MFATRRAVIYAYFLISFLAKMQPIFLSFRFLLFLRAFLRLMRLFIAFFRPS